MLFEHSGGHDGEPSSGKFITWFVAALWAENQWQHSPSIFSPGPSPINLISKDFLLPVFINPVVVDWYFQFNEQRKWLCWAKWFECSGLQLLSRPQQLVLVTASRLPVHLNTVAMPTIALILVQFWWLLTFCCINVVVFSKVLKVISECHRTDRTQVESTWSCLCFPHHKMLVFQKK